MVLPFLLMLIYVKIAQFILTYAILVTTVFWNEDYPTPRIWMIHVHIYIWELKGFSHLNIWTVN